MTELERSAAGVVSVSPAALSTLVVRASEQVDGARVHRPRRSLSVEVEGGQARVSLALSARRGVVLPELAREVQERVAGMLRAMLEVEVEAVDVSIEGVHD